MKKTFLSMVLVAGFLGACSHQPNSALRGHSGDVGIPEMTNFVATVKNAAFTKECAKKVKAIAGVNVESVLETIGVISFSSTPDQSALVSQLSCILSVDEDLDVGIPETTYFNATVKDAADLGAFTRNCAKRVKAISGVNVTAVLEEIGVITFTSTPEESELVAKLGCVLSVDVDITVGPLPSTRVGN